MKERILDISVLPLLFVWLSGLLIIIEQLESSMGSALLFFGSVTTMVMLIVRYGNNENSTESRPAIRK